MMKTMRFQPGTFLEVDDLAGGRKVVMVCKDGVTFWDMLDAKEATPLVIHPSMNPVEIGTFAQFSAAKGLQRATRKVIAFLRRRLDTRLDSDPLFVMRVLWFAAQKGQATPTSRMTGFWIGRVSRPSPSSRLPHAFTGTPRSSAWRNRRVTWARC
ncbi:hypothetical protein [Aeromonas veronii]|uniref:hypothetical protein n=1 Tax=Aeromonas veronii TaxID=654 RepID=UPI001F0B02F0|nr:hypothetical protein [Aeromonas veronii]